MNQRRCIHSSTAIGDKAFVVGGYNAEDQYLDTIEMLDLGKDSEWLTVANEQFSPRACPSFCAISPTRLLIAGGDIDG